MCCQSMFFPLIRQRVNNVCRGVTHGLKDIMRSTFLAEIDIDLWPLEDKFTQ